MFINNYETVLTIEKSATNLEFVLQHWACKKVNAAGTDENLFRLVPALWHGARVLPLELESGYGSQISAQAPTSLSLSLKDALSLWLLFSLNKRSVFIINAGGSAENHATPCIATQLDFPSKQEFQSFPGVF